jgi:hypothetical protein
LELGRILIFIGILFILGGAVILFFPNSVSWIGSLPGDIRITRGRSKVFIPVSSMILLSILLTLFVNVIVWIVKLLSK